MTVLSDTDRPGRRLALRVRFVVWAVAFTALLLNLISWFAWSVTCKIWVDLTVERNNALLRLQAQRLAAGVGDCADWLVNLAAQPDLMGYLSAGKAMSSLSSAGLCAFDGGLVVLDPEGWVLAATESLRFAVGQNWIDRPYAQPVIGVPFRYSNLLNPGPSGLPTLALAVPLPRPDNASATLIGLLELDHSPFYAAISHAMRDWTDGDLYLVDGGGEVIYPRAAHLAQAEVQAGVQRVLNGQHGSILMRRSDGGRALIGFAPVAGTPWGLVSQTDWDVIAAVGRRERHVLFGMLLIGMLASWSTAVLSMRQIIRPLDTLIAVVQQAAESDPTHQILATPADDLRALAAQFKRMTERLHELYAGLEQRVSDRTRELSALYQVATVARVSLDLDEALARSLDQVLAVIACEIGMVHLLDQENETLRLAAWRGIPATEEIQKAIGLHERKLITWVFEQTTPVSLPHIADSPYPWHVFAVPGERPYVGAPMRATGRTVGVLSVIGAAGQQFGADECALLAAVADQIAVTVENVRLRAEAEQVALLQERERLARDLHDSVTQSLYSLTLWIEAGQRSLRAGDLAHVEEYLDRLEEGTRQAIRDMRLLVYELRPPALEYEGLVGALQERLDAVEKRSGVQAQLIVKGTIDLPPKVEESLYRIAQEALNNALKHAAASKVSVYLHSQEDTVILEIVDNGVGFDRNSTGDTGGMGLANMQQRAAQLGGTLDIVSLPGQGTQVRAVIPFTARRLRRTE